MDALIERLRVRAADDERRVDARDSRFLEEWVESPSPAEREAVLRAEARAGAELALVEERPISDTDADRP